MKLPKPKLFSVVATVGDIAKGVKGLMQDAKDLKALVLEHNSVKDQQFQEAHPLPPLPPPSAPDYQQIIVYGVYGLRAVALSLEMAESIGEFAKNRVAPQ